MTFRKLLLGTTALLGAGCLAVAMPQAAFAQDDDEERSNVEVVPGGALDVTISGFIRGLATGGQIDNARLDNSIGTGLDFLNDTEVHVILEGEHDATGLEYGGTVEFEADTNRTDNTDETFVFVSGGFGEIRLGDEDGVADNSNVGGNTLAAGTGGTDGTVVDSIGTGVVFLTGTSDATKIRYYTPSFGGVTAAVSYTPTLDGINSGGNNGDVIASRDIEADNVVEGALVYEGEFGGFEILSSVVGLYGEIQDEDAVGGGEDYYGIQGGLSFDIFGFQLAGSVATEEVGNAEKSFTNLGIGVALGPTNISLNGGWVFDSDDLTTTATDRAGNEATATLDNPYNIVLSADVALMPGLVLAGDVGYFNNDVDSIDGFDTDGDGDIDDTDEPTEDDGVQGVVRLGLAF